MTLPEKIASLYLSPAVDVPAAADHERWKPVHYAAGMIIGAATRRRGCELDRHLRFPSLAPSVRELAENMVEQTVEALHVVTRALTLLPNQQKQVAIIAAGFRKRVDEQLAKLGE